MHKMFGLVGLAIGLSSFALAQPTRVWIAVPSPALDKALSALDKAPQTPPVALSWATLDELERLELLGIQTQMFSPPRTARALALLSAAMNDTLLLLRGHQGYQANVAVASAAQEVMLYLHPTFPNLKDAVRQTVADIYDQAATGGFAREGLEASRQVGRQVGLQVVEFGRRDGANHQVIPQYPRAAPGLWVWPLGRPAAEPGWGEVIPIGIAKDQLAQAVPPPAWDSPQYRQELTRFWEEQQKLDDKGKAIADKWAGDPGTVTPAGLWQEAAVQLLRSSTAEQAVTLLAPLNIAMHNSFIACWKAKFTYYTLRPNQWVATFDKQWKPYLRTPRFPAYPSGHSSVSGAAATMLAAFFPSQAQTWWAMAQEASYSRITGGIHWFVDGEGGLDLGQRVAEQVLAGLK